MCGEGMGEPSEGRCSDSPFDAPNPEQPAADASHDSHAAEEECGDAKNQHESDECPNAPAEDANSATDERTDAEDTKEDQPPEADNVRVDVVPEVTVEDRGALGNDSGVEVAAGEYASSGAPDPPSCASSLISCGSGCDDSFDVPPRKSADDFKTNAAGDGTSEGGSESSSVTGGGPPSARRTAAAGKKRVAVAEPNRAKPALAPRPSQSRAPHLATRDRARSREKSQTAERPPPPGPKPAVAPRARPKAPPDSLAVVSLDTSTPKVKATKTSTARCRPPTEEVRSPRQARTFESPVAKFRIGADSKAAFDKYATLPRRKRETSPDAISGGRDSRDIRGESMGPEVAFGRSSVTPRRSAVRDSGSPPLRSLPPYPKRRLTSRIRIYHETSAQTALSGVDVQNALAGIGIDEIKTDFTPIEKVNKGIQVEGRMGEKERLEQRVKALTEANSKLQTHCDVQTEKLQSTETRLEEERAEKVAAQHELQSNTKRVLEMLGGGGVNCGGDSLMLLESQLYSSANIVTKQQEEINRLHRTCMDLKREVDAGMRTHRSLETALREQEREASELQDFLHVESASLAEDLREAEEALRRRGEECRALVRLGEQRRQEALCLKARLARGTRGAVCGTRAGVMPGLAARLRGLLDALVAKHHIPTEDLEDVIFHNEAFSRSGSSEACSPGSPPHRAPARISDDENSADLLDSETEPCLMMESVLEDVQIPDTYSHNLVSSGIGIVSTSTVQNNGDELSNGIHHSDNRFPIPIGKEDSCNSLQNLTIFSGDELSPVLNDDRFVSDASFYQEMNTVDILRMDYSENDSLHNLSQAILQRQQSEAECSISEDHKDGENYTKSASCVVDQVILVDNLVTKLLKVLKIIQLDGEGGGQHLKSVKKKPLEALEECSVNSVARKMADLNVNHKIHAEHKLVRQVKEHSVDDIKTPDRMPEQKIQEEECQSDKEWRNRPPENQFNTQQCSVEEQISPRNALPDCNANGPQPINSAA